MTESTDKADFYQLLGVERTATTQEIRAAFKEQSKIYHPDNRSTGNEARFKDLFRARNTLTNQKSRDVYDSLGMVEETDADNAVAHMLGALTGMFGTVMGTVLKANGEPAKGDFLAAMQGAITANFDGMSKQIVQLEKSRASLANMAGRFKVRSLEQPNHLETIVTGQLGLIDRQLEQTRGQLRLLEAARLYLHDVEFEQET